MCQDQVTIMWFFPEKLFFACSSHICFASSSEWYIQKHSSTALVLFSPSAEVKTSSSFMEKPLNTLKNVNHYPQTTTQNLTCYTHLRQLEIVRSKQGFWNVSINEFHVNTEVLLYPSTAIT